MGQPIPIPDIQPMIRVARQSHNSLQYNELYLHSTLARLFL